MNALTPEQDHGTSSTFLERYEHSLPTT